MKKINHVSNELIQSSYWQFQVETNDIDELLFSNLYAKTLNKETKFIYMAFVDNNKDIFRSGWSAYDSSEKLLGFLEHIYLPTLVYNWYDNQSESLFIPMAPLEVVKSALDEYVNSFVGYNCILEMKDLLGNESMRQNISSFSSIFEYTINNNFNQYPQIAYIKIFHDLDAVKEFLHDEIPFDEVFEEEMGMTAVAFDDVCDHIETLPLLNKILVSQLNQKIPIIGF